MARLVLRALEAAGHTVTLVSEFRSFSRDPQGHAGMASAIEAERARIRACWGDAGRPDLWLTYHVYYKAPDYLGPVLSAEAGIAYVTMEASWSARREGQGWQAAQAVVLQAVRGAALNICLTGRDEQGLAEAAPEARTVRLKPFLDATDFLAVDPSPEPGRLLTIAMMRPGDKLESYRALAAALEGIDRPFVLDIVGDGPCRSDVEALFRPLAPGRVVFHGELARPQLLERLRRASVYGWPGVGEAYGMAYLEAAASGLPAVAFRTGGVPEVVEDGRSGLLVPSGDAGAFRDAVSHLLQDGSLRQRLATEARAMIVSERTLDKASARLDGWLTTIGKGTT